MRKGVHKSIDFRLYLVTDRSQGGERGLLNTIEEALRGGVGAVQLREKGLSGRELLDLAHKVRHITSLFNAKLFINDRVDVAIAVGADGVHLGESALRPGDVTSKWETLLVGSSTHSLESAKRAEMEGACFVTFGPVFFTPSKARYGKPQGIGNLKKVSEEVIIPVFAIGGVKPGHVREVMNRGNAFGVALISGIMGAANPREATTTYLQIIEGRD